MFRSAVNTTAGLRVCLAVVSLLGVITLSLTGIAAAREPDKTLRLYYTHTKERGEFTFKRNGRYDPAVLQRLNQFLRDWRRNEPTQMDPRLFDLLWEAHRQTGSNQYIHVVSAFRSPATNAMLRSRSKGVAENSQHTRGRAIDFYIPGVSAEKLRAIGMRLQGGGVGYYPGARSNFIHLDTGTVRHWPRMTRQQLVALFPNGGTLHIPSDNKPLPGFEQALARYDRDKSITAAFMEARGGPAGRSGRAAPPMGFEREQRDNGTVFAFFKKVFGGGADEEEDMEIARTAPARQAPVPVAPAPAQPQILVAETPAPPAAVQPAPLPKMLPVQMRQVALAALVRPEPPAVAPTPAAVVMVDPAPTTSAASGMTALAMAPTPKLRPDAAFVQPALAAAAPIPTPAAEAYPATPDSRPVGSIVAAMAAVDSNSELPSAADSALLASVAATSVPAIEPAVAQAAPIPAIAPGTAIAAASALSRGAVELPQARPAAVELAYAPAIEPADALVDAAPTPRLRPAAPATAPASAPQAEPTRTAARPAPMVDGGTLRQLMSQSAAARSAPGLAMPTPRGGLFAVPQSVGEASRLSPADAAGQRAPDRSALLDGTTQFVGLR